MRKVVATDGDFGIIGPGITENLVTKRFRFFFGEEHGAFITVVGKSVTLQNLLLFVHV